MFQSLHPFKENKKIKNIETEWNKWNKLQKLSNLQRNIEKTNKKDFVTLLNKIQKHENNLKEKGSSHKTSVWWNSRCTKLH